MPPRTMARPGRERKNPEMILTILRTAFLAYVRLLLCLQGLYLGFWAWTLWPGRAPQGDFWALLGLELLFAFLGLATIAAACLLRPGRRRAAIAAILIEALWATLAAAIACKTLKDWPLDLHLLAEVTVAAALFGGAVVGLLLRPVRAYAGLVRRRSPARPG
jgi:hypothetical protein